MELHEPTAEHVIAHEEVKRLILRHADKVPVYQLLAIAASLVGQIAVLVDLSDRDKADIITKNMKIGADHMHFREHVEGSA